MIILDQDTRHVIGPAGLGNIVFLTELFQPVNEVSRRRFLGGLGATAATAAIGGAAGGIASRLMPGTPYQTVVPQPSIPPSVEYAAPPPMTAKQIENLVKELAMEAGLKGPELAQFLAQCAHESANFNELEENLNYSTALLMRTFSRHFPNERLAQSYAQQPEKIANRVYANRMGNGDESSGDGWRYRGRGFIHLTGKENYQKAGEYIGINLIDEPEMAAHPMIAADIALWYWKKRVRPKVKDFRDTRRTTQPINPAMQGIRSREEKFRQYRQNNT